VRRFLRLGAAIAGLALALTLLLRTVEIRGDIVDFLPPPETPEAAFLMRELRGGAAATLLLAGIEGAPRAELARLSREMGERLASSPLFTLVANGAETISDAERTLVFRYRYLLGEADFREAALRTDLERLLDGLRSSAAPLVRLYGFADPPDAFLRVLRGWLSDSRVEMEGGVWFAPGADRALLLARSAAPALDFERQREAAEAIREAFAAAHPGAARLLLSGPGVFASEAAASIRADVRLISMLSSALITAFLFWRYRSLLMLAIVAVPLSAGTLAGALVTALVFGHVNGAALGFGMTMLGVCDDYPILLVTNGRDGERLSDTARRIWPTLRLAVAAAVAGLAPMLASGLPGLAQLGLFAASGLLAAALVTRFLLPRLVPDAGIRVRDLPTGFATALLRLNRHRAAAIAVMVAAAIALVVLGGPTAERDLAALSPVPERARLLDEELRSQLGAPDVRVVLVIQAPDAEAALRASERAVEALAPLVASGAVGRFDAPSRYLPSIATQHARQAGLPDDATLQLRLEAARQGLPFRPTAFDPFRAGVAESRALPPLTPDALDAAPLLAARLAPLLQRQADGWQAVILPGAVRDPAALARAAAAIPGLLQVDAKAETEAILARQTRLVMLWAAAGAVLVLALLVSGQGLRGGLRIAAALGGALLLTVAGLAMLGERITLFHLAAMLLLAGVSLDYALFMARSDDADPDEAGRALRGVLNCTITTLLTFGLLALCRTPVLHAIGLTVTLGVASAFLLACVLAPGRRAA